MLLPPVASSLVEFLGARDIDAYIVGGALRDGLMGREAEDIDVAVSADAYSIAVEIAETLNGNCARLHDDWPVARVVIAEEGRLRFIDIVTFEGDIERDLCGRDFTINAMAAPMSAALDGDVRSELLDPFGGMRDLANGVVRMVSSDALERDPIRLMRGARMAAQCGFSLAPGTASAIRERSPLVSGVSQERVRDELMRLLGARNARDGVRLLDDLRLLCVVVPELAQAKGVIQPKEHYWDVFDHQVEAVGWVDAMFDDADCEEYPLDIVPRFDGMHEYFGGEVSDGFDRLAFLKLAALLHDVAKPVTKTVEASGRIRFLGHHTDGADVARDILTRLRFGKRGVEHIARMVRQHLRPRQMAQRGDMPTRRALYRYYRDVGDVALDTLYLNTADYLAARGPMLEREDWAAHCGLVRYILDEGRCEGDRCGDSVKSLPKLVDGYDIMNGFALAPGPFVGELLEEVREAQASGDVQTREQALELVRAGIERGGDGA
jgi:poly(A) polymerase